MRTSVLFLFVFGLLLSSQLVFAKKGRDDDDDDDDDRSPGLSPSG